MKSIHLTLASIVTVAFAATAADVPKEQLEAAAKALATKANYSWTTTVKVPADTQFQPGPTEGMTTKDGLIMVSQSFGPGQMQIVKHGDKAAMTNRDGGWESVAEIEQTEGFGRFRADRARNLVTPAADVLELVKALNEVKKDGDAFSGEFTEEGAKGMIGFGGRRGGGPGGGANVSDASASAKFWVADGVLSKMEIKVSGKMEFNGNEMAVDRTTITEITKVGSTKVEIPEAAKDKMK